MMAKRHMIFHAIPAITIVWTVALALSEIGSHPEPPWIGMLLINLTSVAVWSAVFAVAMFVYAFQNKHWTFLALALSLLAARCVYFSEAAWGNTEDHLYLWLPVEYIVFYLLMHKDTKGAKCGFVLITTGLYVLCGLTNQAILSWWPRV